tara:strand:- start:43 stop:264 length:222 start_codon:yes stop_codon:yes gene_type:complete
MYSKILHRDELSSIHKTDGHLYIPLDPANRHYQEVLDAIIEQGADCFDGDIPADLQTAADAKLASGAYNANRA